MCEKQHYDYVVLRYVHDIVSQEFVNVGVVLFSPSDQRLVGRFQEKFARIKKFFPDFEKRAFSTSLEAIQRGLDHERSRTELSIQLSKTTDFTSRLHQVLPKDDSALQWSNIGSGVSANFDEALDQLFTRFVSRYDKPETVADHKNVAHNQ